MKNFLAIFLFLALGANLAAQDADVGLAAVSREETLSHRNAVILGLVEGVTEFIPVSSTGHLILANFFLNLDAENPVTGSDGELIMSRKPNADGSPRFYTVKEALDGYAIVIQIAAIAAVALIYWREVFSMLMGFIGRDRNGLMLARNLIAAFIPAAFIGFFLHDYIEEFLFGVWPVIVALTLGAFAMIYLQRKYQKRFDDSAEPVELHNLTLRQSLFVGLMQCVALWPGTSRSMMTILGSYMVGLKPVQAAKFTFLLGLITLSAAGVFKILRDGTRMLDAIPTVPMFVGFFFAFISSAIAAKWLVGFLSRKGLVPFAVYRLVLAAVLAIIFFLKNGN